MKVEVVEGGHEEVNNNRSGSGRMEAGPGVLALLSLATAGASGPDLGSDEEEVVLLLLALLDVESNQVWAKWRRRDKPTVESEATSRQLSIQKAHKLIL